MSNVIPINFRRPHGPPAASPLQDCARLLDDFARLFIGLAANCTATAAALREASGDGPGGEAA